MTRFTAAMYHLGRREFHSYHNRTESLCRYKPKDYNVFINHKGSDTKLSLATLLYDHLSLLNARPFLDMHAIKPGEKILDKIDSAIRSCKVGVAIISPNYGKSYYCLHELALMMELNKKVIPIFCDVKPSELRVAHEGSHPVTEVQRFQWALEEAKYTLGLAFDPLKG